MNERWQEIEWIYHRALELDGSARAEFLARACMGYSALREQVEFLQAQTGRQEAFSGDSHRQDTGERVR